MDYNPNHNTPACITGTIPLYAISCTINYRKCIHDLDLYGLRNLGEFPPLGS